MWIFFVGSKCNRKLCSCSNKCCCLYHRHHHHHHHRHRHHIRCRKSFFCRQRNEKEKKKRIENNTSTKYSSAVAASFLARLCNNRLAWKMKMKAHTVKYTVHRWACTSCHPKLSFAPPEVSRHFSIAGCVCCCNSATWKIFFFILLLFYCYVVP